MIYLERHSPESNVHRYYCISLRQDMFGAWVMERNWGRVGRHGGQSMTLSFSSEDEAQKELRHLQQLKAKRGYFNA